MTDNTRIATVGDSDAGQRLDRFLTAHFSDLSRSRLQDLIARGHVTCNGAVTHDTSGKVKAGQEFTVTIPNIVASHIAAQEIALDIVYEDEDLLVINKQAGLTVHPAPGHPDMTLVNALLAHCGDSLSGIGGVARPGIVHRIDKDTTGLMVVAKHDAAHASLSEQLAERTLKRTYTALVWGHPKSRQAKVTGNIDRSTSNRQKMTVVKTGGRDATTHYKVIGECDTPPVSVVECKLETGRTHQIRVHMTHLGHPLLGDPIYGQTTPSRLAGMSKNSVPAEVKAALLAFNRQALHARELGLIHPTTGAEMRFSCDLPEDIQTLMAALHLS